MDVICSKCYYSVILHGGCFFGTYSFMGYSELVLGIYPIDGKTEESYCLG